MKLLFKYSLSFSLFWIVRVVPWERAGQTWNRAFSSSSPCDCSRQTGSCRILSASTRDCRIWSWCSKVHHQPQWPQSRVDTRMPPQSLESFPPRSRPTLCHRQRWTICETACDCCCRALSLAWSRAICEWWARTTSAHSGLHASPHHCTFLCVLGGVGGGFRHDLKN